MARGGRSFDGYQVKTNGMRSPSRTVNSPTVRMFSPRFSTGVLKQSASGPATAMRESSIRRTQGIVVP
jgi:hypothetical protein